MTVQVESPLDKLNEVLRRIPVNVYNALPALLEMHISTGEKKGGYRLKVIENRQGSLEINLSHTNHSMYYFDHLRVVLSNHAGKRYFAGVSLGMARLWGLPEGSYILSFELDI